MDDQNRIETVEEPGFGYHFLWYFLQLIFSAPGVMIASLPLWLLLSKLGLSEGRRHGKFAGYEVLLVLFVGILVGRWMAGRAPLLRKSGKWIWVLPMIVTLRFVIRAAGPPSPVPWLSDYLFAYGDEGGLAVGFITLPVTSIAGYSIGMALAGAKRKRTTMLLGAAVSFIVLALLLHAFEMRSIARFARLRSVLGNSGLQLLPDAQSLCGPQTSSRTGQILPSGIIVESLGRVACDGDRLTSANTLPAPIIGRSGPYFLEHVRVLTGPSAGREGGVMQYGLMELLRE